MAKRTLQALADRDFDFRKARHLLNRAGFGGTPGQVRALANMGLDAAVDYIVDYEAVDDPPVEADAFDRNIMKPLSRDERDALQRARRTSDEMTLGQFRKRRQDAQRADRAQMRELQKWWLARMIESPRPLEEKMTLFWHGHFATNYRAIEDSYHMFLQNQLFRHHAAGEFGALTHAIVRDPAMLRYLNNDQNRRRQPNENLARELMELFTLGEGNEYAEQDIKEGARALTGYTYHDDEFIGLGSREYRRRHDDGTKRILGKVGDWDGDDFVDLILGRRSCSEFICWKLYRYFVNDLPGVPDQQRQRFIGDLAAMFRGDNYELTPMLKTLFRSRHFYDPSNVGTQIKSPVQLIVQTVRTVRTPTRSLRALLSAADLMGQNIFYPPSVKGWAGGRSWINTSTMFVRQNVMVYLLTGRRPDMYPWDEDATTCDLAHLIDHLRSARGEVDAREAVAYLLRISLAAEPLPQRVDGLAEFVEARGGRLDNTMLIALMCLITAMPEYQLC
ncbi:MAG: DUF1800 domain-containing protein [Planctomycetota bacterium]|jgi:uncharacterized protein (DUF1800 family)